MAEHHHEHGTMDTAAQQETFKGFVRTIVIAGVLTAATLIFLAFVGT